MAHRMTEEDLAARLNVSRTPVREVLQAKSDLQNFMAKAS